jgi:sRNA-binding carbon storage regulator CsrA
MDVHDLRAGEVIALGKDVCVTVLAVRQDRVVLGIATPEFTHVVALEAPEEGPPIQRAHEAPPSPN